MKWRNILNYISDTEGALIEVHETQEIKGKDGKIYSKKVLILKDSEEDHTVKIH